MKQPAVHFDHVSFSYGETPVLDDVSFSIQTGEFVGVIGPNGGGKTTLLKLLMGFLKPISGSIDLFQHAPHTGCENISYVPQIARFDRQFPISVEEVVLAGRLATLRWYGTFHSDDKKAAADALEKVGLLSYRNASFGTLSGGQAQRVLIARALASHPRLLLLDEPTASVDAQAEAEIYALLRTLHSEGITIIMVTHDIRAIIQEVQRVLCVQRQVTELSPQAVCNHFAFGVYHTGAKGNL